MFTVTFFAVGDGSKGGDAILLQLSGKGHARTILIDGGFCTTYRSIRDQLPTTIDDVVCSHFDADHVGGLIELLKDQSKTVKKLWLTPESRASALDLASRVPEQRRPHFVRAMLEDRRHLVMESIRQGAELLRLAETRGIRPSLIKPETKIGPFHVLSPTEALREDIAMAEARKKLIEEVAAMSLPLNEQEALRAFSEAAVSISNEMSTVLFSDLNGELPGGIMLTSDAGPRALEQALETARQHGIGLDKLTVLQLPHHGSKHNFPMQTMFPRITASLIVVSAPPQSQDHPDPHLIRQLKACGISVHATQGSSLRLQGKAPREMEKLGAQLYVGGEIVLYRMPW